MSDLSVTLLLTSHVWGGGGETLIVTSLTPTRQCVSVVERCEALEDAMDTTCIKILSQLNFQHDRRIVTSKKHKENSIKMQAVLP